MEFDDPAAPERLTHYVEKPTLSYEVSMGVYCFAPRVLEHIEPERAARLPRPDPAAARARRARRGVAAGAPTGSTSGATTTTSRRCRSSTSVRHRLLPGRGAGAGSALTQRVAHGGDDDVDAGVVLVGGERQREVAVGRRLRRRQRPGRGERRELGEACAARGSGSSGSRGRRAPRARAARSAPLSNSTGNAKCELRADVGVRPHQRQPGRAGEPPRDSATTAARRRSMSSRSRGSASRPSAARGSSSRKL